jgi:hypothetical protein
MIGGMDESDPKRALGGSPIEHVLHEAPTNGTILHRGIDGDRAETDDGRAFVEEIAADDVSVELGHNGIESEMGQSLRHTCDRDFGCRIGGGKVVLPSYGLEGFIADRPAHCGVFRLARAEYK